MTNGDRITSTAAEAARAARVSRLVSLLWRWLFQFTPGLHPRAQVPPGYVTLGYAHRVLARSAAVWKVGLTPKELHLQTAIAERLRPMIEAGKVSVLGYELPEVSNRFQT